MINIPNLLDLLKAGAHFGHRPSKRYPKMEPYLYNVKDGVDIINLEKTQEKLKEALELVEKIAKADGTILFVGTKRQAKAIVKKYAQVSGMPYVIERWVGGTFTNLSNIIKLINKLKSLEEKKLSGELRKYTKKEQLEFDKKINKLEFLVGGIRNLTKLPAAVYLIDLKKEKTALAEAIKTKIPVIAICDSNTNPVNVAYPIPANDDATKTIELITSLIAAAIVEGRKK